MVLTTTAIILMMRINNKNNDYNNFLLRVSLNTCIRNRGRNVIKYTCQLHVGVTVYKKFKISKANKSNNILFRMVGIIMVIIIIIIIIAVKQVIIIY